MLNTILRNTFQSTFILENAPEINNILVTAKSLTTYFKQSGNVKYLSKTLLQNIDIRWNTKHNMLQSIYIMYDEIFLFLQSRDMTKKMGSMGKEDLKTLIDYLEPYKDATNALEGDCRPTLQNVLIWYNLLHEHNEINMNIMERKTKYEKEIDIIKKRAKNFIIEKFKIHMLHKVLTFLIPKFRQMRMLSSEEINEVKKHIENLLDLICIEECNIDVDENLILPISPKAKRIQLKASTSKLNPNRWENEVVTEDSTIHNDITEYLYLKISIEEEDILQ
ncbi:uncharacterized protein LOC135925889 [Gordionus sp. m RMFG-2023]|uniref:uncharacterized protein LOC135925889 n=1 Tax=Gordionus sp. m RMFG-2023 TaxID=3053472 RepID=UPI0031FD18A0